MIDPGLFQGIEGGEELLRQQLAGQESAAQGDGPAAPDAAFSPLPADSMPETSGPAAPIPAGTSAARRNRRPVLYIDADACPVTREALAVARATHIHAVVAGNTTQNLEAHILRDDPREPAQDGAAGKGRGGFWVSTLVAPVGADSADFEVVTCLEPGDVVVTQDIGLASICLGRGARAIGVRGRPYDPATIDSQMFIRHLEKRVRRQGGRTQGPAPFTEDDRRRFKANLRRIVDELL